MLYTGFTKEELELFIYTKERFGRFIEQFDLIVTDPFILEQRDLNLLYRGSKNQRLCVPTWIGESLFIDDITETYGK
jgi:anaerobic ribonucleoside-triphosphate reductase activating protein